MDKNRVEGSLQQAKGAVQKAAGDLTGDAKLKAEGTGNKIAGKIKNAVGGAADAADEK